MEKDAEYQFWDALAAAVYAQYTIYCAERDISKYFKFQEVSCYMNGYIAEAIGWASR